MADPLSIAASVVGLLSAASKVSSIFMTITTTLKDAPVLAHFALTEVNSIRAALSSLQLFLERLDSQRLQRAACIHLDPLIATLTDAVLAFSKLESIVDQFSDVNFAGFGGFQARLKLLSKEQAILSCVSRLQNHKASVTLMLNILQCNSDLEAAMSVRKLEVLIERLLENDVQLTHRLGQLEDTYDAKSILTRRQQNTIVPDVNDDTVTIIPQEIDDIASVVSRRVDFDALDSAAALPSQYQFEFEEELQSCRVYKRTQFYPEDRETMISSAIRTHAWSVFSGLSLADLSVVSVIALPLWAADIANSHHYAFKTSDTDMSSHPWSWRQFRFDGDSGKSLFPRYGPAVNAIATSSGHVYLMGGLVDDNLIKADLWHININVGPQYFPCTQISHTGRVPQPRCGHRLVVAGNALCLFGGDIGEEEDSTRTDNELYVLNRGKYFHVILPRTPSNLTIEANIIGETAQWHAISLSEKPSGRYGHSLSYISPQILVFGGQCQGTFHNDLATFDVDSFNPLSSGKCGWEFPPLSRPPPPRTNHTAVVWENKLYIFGGTDALLWHNDLWCYDVALSRWQDLTLRCTGRVPEGREGHTAAVVDGVMYIFGGRNHIGKSLDSLAAINLADLRWHSFRDMGPAPSPRSGHAMVAMGKKIVVIAGEPESSRVKRDKGSLARAYVLDTSKIRQDNIVEEGAPENLPTVDAF